MVLADKLLDWTLDDEQEWLETVFKSIILEVPAHRETRTRLTVPEFYKKYLESVDKRILYFNDEPMIPLRKKLMKTVAYQALIEVADREDIDEATKPRGVN